MSSSQFPRVAAIREEHDDLARALKNAREMLPGLLPRELPRQVVIKPNLCDIAAWETGVTSDPRWVAALAAELRSIRRDVRILLVESDAISAYKSYRSCDETFERLGFVSAAANAGVELVNLSRCGSIEIRAEGIPMPLRIPELFLEEMFFISTANLKVHPYTRMTGVLKNSLGLLTDADISAFHPYLSALISRLHRLFPPDLCIIDGRIGLEGQGPILGDPVRMNTILFSGDALATDQAACRLMEVPAKEVPHLRQVAKDCGRQLGQLQIVGDLQPRKFYFQSQKTHGTILVKFGTRRMYNHMDTFTTRWIDRGLLLRQHPLTFAKNAIRKFTRSRRARPA